MSKAKVVAATCAAGVVTAEGVVIPSAEILSEGVAESAGFLILDEDKAYYVAKLTPDLKETLLRMTDAFEEIYQALATLDSAGFLISATLGVPSPPVAVSNILSLANIRSEILEFRDALK